MSGTYPESDYQQQCSAHELEVRAMLMRWFLALQEQERSGQPIPYLPDPRGVQVSEERAQKIMDGLEHNIWTLEQNWLRTCKADRGGPYEAGPGFDRLTYPQRIAMIQEWSAIKRRYPKEAKPPPARDVEEEVLRQMFRNAMEDGIV